MAELLDQGSDLELGTREIVESVTLPAGRAGDVFWSHRVRRARAARPQAGPRRSLRRAHARTRASRGVLLQQAAAAAAYQQRFQCLWISGALERAQRDEHGPGD